jgi:putative DNA primase/helicase
VSTRGEPRTWQYLAMWDGPGIIALDAARAMMPANDLDAAVLLAAERPGEMHYVPRRTNSTWHIWDGQCHRPDDGGATGRVVLDLADRYAAALEQCRCQLAAEIAATYAPDQREKELEAAWKLWAAPVKYAAGLRMAKGQADLEKVMARICSVPPDYLADTHPEWINHPGGTTDLRTGATWAHRPADLLTYCLPVMPGMVWDCPRFLALVRRVAVSDAVAGYVLRVLGYALLGYNPERLVFFLNGPSSSGKTIVLYIVRQLLGVLAIESPADLITWSPRGRNARVENSVRGMRLITINETSAWMHIEEAQLKRITGEPEINVDRHYDTDRIRTRVSWLIINATNDMPGVPLLDGAIRERMVVVPCGETIPAEQRVKDLAEEILAHEAPGIAATLMHYAGLYFREGLKPPLEVEQATEYYCSHQNVAAQYAADKLVCGLGWDRKVPGHQLWKSAQEWARDDRKLPSRTAFYEMLAKLDGITRDTVKGSAVFHGVDWKVEAPNNWQ